MLLLEKQTIPYALWVSANRNDVKVAVTQKIVLEFRIIPGISGAQPYDMKCIATNYVRNSWPIRLKSVHASFNG